MAQHTGGVDVEALDKKTQPSPGGTSVAIAWTLCSSANRTVFRDTLRIVEARHVIGELLHRE